MTAQGDRGESRCPSGVALSTSAALQLIQVKTFWFFTALSHTLASAASHVHVPSLQTLWAAALNAALMHTP